MITKAQQDALFMDVHRAIEESARKAASAVCDSRVDLNYPPGVSLSSREESAIASVQGSPDLESALRKVIANAASSPLFRLFCLIDGVGDPADYEADWPCFVLSELSDEEGSSDYMLHDEFFETYWKWKEKSEDPI